MKNKMMGIIFASGSEDHLNQLTIHRTTASLPFAGRYRIIDFPLSNFVSANITTVGIVTKSNYNSLMDHIRMGRDWDLNRKNSGITVFPPMVFDSAHNVYKGKIEALYMLRGYMLESNEEYVVVTNSNSAFNIDFNEVFKYHIDKGADITALTYRTSNINNQKMVIKTDKNNRIVDMRHTTADDKGEFTCYLNVFLVKKDLLIALVDEAYAHGLYNFKENILQAKVNDLYIMNYEVKSYVGVMDRIQSYYDCSMELLKPEVRQDLFYAHSTILTKIKDSVPTKYLDGANVKNSIIADGCVIDGTVENSILFRSVHVGKGAVIKNSIIMEDGIIMENSSLNCVVADKDVIIKSGRTLSGEKDYPLIVVKGKVI